MKKFYILFISGIIVLIISFLYLFFTSPQIIKISPINNQNKVDLNSKIEIEFNRPIKRREIKIETSPNLYGEISFKKPLVKDHLYRKVIFNPVLDLKNNEKYIVNVKNIKGFISNNSSDFSFSFKTDKIQNETLNQKEEDKIQNKILNIELDWQDYSLSCEAASLKMALRYKGFNVTENQIMNKIGIDPTPKKNGIWGDPYSYFVGDIDGKICSTGFGVFKEPVERAAKVWTEAKSFSKKDIDFLIEEIYKGNPVIVWGVLPGKKLSYCSWKTKTGKDIKVFKQTHVRLLIGFIGDKNNPKQVVLNDPLSGRIYWSTSYFLENWGKYNRSGVIVK